MTAPLQLIALTFRLDADVESRLLAEVDRIEGRGAVIATCNGAPSVASHRGGAAAAATG